jgi:hypothetical protein
MSYEGLVPSAVTKLSWDDGVAIDPENEYGDSTLSQPVPPLRSPPSKGRAFLLSSLAGEGSRERRFFEAGGRLAIITIFNCPINESPKSKTRVSMGIFRQKY